jgi:hypothetical protein
MSGVAPIADIRADIDFGREVPEGDITHGVSRPSFDRRKHHYLLTATEATRARANDLTGLIARYDGATALRAAVSGAIRNVIVFRTDIGAHHMMKD